MERCSFGSYYEKIFATGEVKCIDDEIPFEIPQGWEWCRLRDLCTVFGRIGFRGYTRNDIVEKGFGAITLSPSNMQDNGNMNYSVVSYISWKKYEESPEIKVKANDVLIVKTGSSYGKTCIISDLPEKATINPQIAVLKYSFVNNQWLTYFLNAPFAQEQFRKYVIGTSIPTFSQEKLSSTLLPLPPQNEQEHLTKKLNLLDKWIGSYNVIQQLIDRLNADIYDKLKKSILQEAIQGKLVPQIAEEGTAQELLEQIQEEKQRLVNEGKLKKSALTSSVIFKGDNNKYYEQVGASCNDITDEIPFDLPCNWCWCRFFNIVSMTIGKTPARGEQTYWINGAYNWVSISDMVDGGIISATKEKVSDLAAKEIFSAPISGKGSLLMSFKLSIGKTSILDIDAYHNEAIITIRPIIDKEYVMRNYLFKVLPLIANLGESKDAIKGKTLNSKSLSNLLIPLPTLLEQKRIVEKIIQLTQLLK